jgi:hypothetical protein
MFFLGKDLFGVQSLPPAVGIVDRLVSFVERFFFADQPDQLWSKLSLILISCL